MQITTVYMAFNIISFGFFKIFAQKPILHANFFTFIFHTVV